MIREGETALTRCLRAKRDLIKTSFSVDKHGFGTFDRHQALIDEFEADMKEIRKAKRTEKTPDGEWIKIVPLPEEIKKKQAPPVHRCVLPTSDYEYTGSQWRCVCGIVWELDIEQWETVWVKLDNG